MVTTKITNIDQYIASFPDDIQELLQQIRATIKKAAPHAVETIKYGMPAFMQDGNLAYFGVFKNHIGFYPAPTGNENFEKDLLAFKTGKGSVQFPTNKPMPLSLITRMVKYRMMKISGKEE